MLLSGLTDIPWEAHQDSSARGSQRMRPDRGMIGNNAEMFYAAAWSVAAEASGLRQSR